MRLIVIKSLWFSTIIMVILITINFLAIFIIYYTTETAFYLRLTAIIIYSI